MAPPRRLRPPSDAALVKIVREAIYGAETLDTLFAHLLFGDVAPPRMWGDWPIEAREAWDRAVRFWAREHPGLYLPGREKNPHREDVGGPGERRAAWNVVLEFGGVTWPDVPHVTWPRLAAKLKLGPRAVEHHFRMMGWRFDGRGGRRFVVEAPCEACGKVWCVDQMVGREGPCCLTK